MPSKSEPQNSQAAAWAFCFLTFIAVTKTLLTKLVFKHVNTPVAFSVLSCVATILCILPVFLFKRSMFNWLSRDMYTGFFYVCVAIAVDLGCTNVAISELSVAFQQCIKAASPAATIILETIVTGKLQHPVVYLVIVILCTGTVITGLGSSDYDSSFKGIVMMTTAVFAGAFKYVWAHSMIRTFKEKMGTLAFTFWVEVFVAAMLFPWAYLNGEIGELFWPSATDDTASYSTMDWALLWFTAAYGGVRIYSQFVLLQFTSATTLALSNVTIQAFTTILGIWLFHTEVTQTLALGVAITLLASGAYTYIKVSGQCAPSSGGKAMH